MTAADTRASDDAHVAVARRRVLSADLFRAAGLGFAVVWATSLGLVVAFWVRVVFYPRPGDEVSAWNDVALAPVALVSAVLTVWVLLGAWRLVVRRPGGVDPVVVVGSFAIAVAVLVWAPGRFVEGLDSAPRSWVVGLAVLGVCSVVTGMLGQRAWGRAAAVQDPVPAEDPWSHGEAEPAWTEPGPTAHEPAHEAWGQGLGDERPTVAATPDGQPRADEAGDGDDWAAEPHPRG